MVVYAGKICDIGKRPNNEDSVYVDLRNGLFVVADGAGGEDSGEVASNIVVTIIKDYIASSKCHFKDRKRLLIEAIKAANLRIYQIATTQKKATMATTTTALLIGPGVYFIAHVGDSRAYFTSDKKIKQITKDHSKVQEMVDAGIITQEQARHHELSNIITRAVGIKPEIEIDTFEGEFRDRNSIILCSDGLWGSVSDEEIVNITHSINDPQNACEKLVEMAINNGATDNISVIIAQSRAYEKKTGRMGELINPRKINIGKKTKLITKTSIGIIIGVFLIFTIIKVISSFKTVAKPPSTFFVTFQMSPEILNVSSINGRNFGLLNVSDSLLVTANETLIFSQKGYYSETLAISEKEKMYKINLQKIYVPVYFSVIPSTANIVIKDVKQTSSEHKLINTDSISLPYGIYNVIISCSQYTRVETILQINDTKPESLSVVLTKAEEKIPKPPPKYNVTVWFKVDSVIINGELLDLHHADVEVYTFNKKTQTADKLVDKDHIPCQFKLTTGNSYLAKLIKDGELIATGYLSEVEQAKQGKGPYTFSGHDWEFINHKKEKK